MIEVLIQAIDYWKLQVFKRLFHNLVLFFLKNKTFILLNKLKKKLKKFFPNN